MDKKALGVGVGLGSAGVLLVLLLVAMTVSYSGAYNVAATEDHTPFVRWMFTTTMHNSIKDRAADVKPPPAFTATMVKNGAAEYKSMCQHCHAGPGVERSRWARGMLPQPPHLAEAASEWKPNEVFWIAKHGIKMTGMPAFGPTHDDETLWNIVAFVQQLPGMTAEKYASYESHGSHGH